MRQAVRGYFTDATMHKRRRRGEENMRMTIHNARANHLGTFTSRHNDRNFDISHADHIDPEKTKSNFYWNWTGRNDISFEDAEKAFYEKHISRHLNEVNQRYEKQRHPERVRDMDTYRKARQTCPEETLLMIGHKNEYLPPKTLQAICSDLRKWEEKTIPGLHVLDMALHVDEEGAPHVHMRKAWLYSDKNGLETISQGKALEAAGIPLPHPEKPQGRNNNRKQTFSRMERQAFYEICRGYGLENLIETKPRERSKSGLSQAEYKAQQIEKQTEQAFTTLINLHKEKKMIDFQLKLKKQEYEELITQIQEIQKQLIQNKNLLHLAEQRQAFMEYQNNREHERTR